ncbi:SDR family oxidoreductase [Chryseobacterium takakiae]|uniref:Nucleoside-diphosphate-sugar epimerase n=1 Tax=Chryseobacterium takakiae TaxID=1302685 RepID=A0A1M4WFI7_9FLAO|nr:SDR family oxidoreductase [Chryseobacterium takakiae]SHE80019.1 Nucleoside-diphosphate-sugar epimerase [Chryseobacterium takakiae]
MKVFVTGASGFIGSAIVKELIDAGHQVTGLARSERSAEKIRQAGAEAVEGDLADLEILRQNALYADGIIHAAFSHDFMISKDISQFPKAAEMDRLAIEAMGEVLINTDKPLIVTAGLLGLPLINGKITEESIAENSLRASEATALKLAEKGVNASVIRLAPSVHDVGDYGFVPFIISKARENGVSAYPGDGNNRWTGIHRLDAARLFRLALEKGVRGALYNGVEDESMALKELAGIIGEKLHVPMEALSGEDLNKHFEWLAHFITMDCPVTNLKTKRQLGWEPMNISLLEDIEQNYF